MMRERFLAVAGLAVAMLGCAGSQRWPAPTLVAPEWQDGEVSVYDVVRNDSVLYRSRMTIQFDEEFEIPTIIATTTVGPVEAGQYFFDTSVVFMRRDSLIPLRSLRSLETDIAFFDVEARYGSGRVVISKQSIDGIESRELRVPRPVYDNEMLLTLLRCLPPVSGTEFRIQAVLALDMRVVPLHVQVLGTKFVTTELGNIMCREVALVDPSREVRLWYEIEEPHRLVGLSDAGNGTEMLLAGYASGGAEAPEPGAP